VATITAKSILDRATIIIQDETNTRWPRDELLTWLNDGQREIVLLKPDSYAQNKSIQLIAGTKQAIPADGIQLIDVVRNMGTDGETPGRVIKRIDRRILDDQRPDWHTEPAVGYVQHYVFDDRDPKTFYVYPQAPETAVYVEVIYSSAPTDITDENSYITLDDIYANAVLDYILYRAYLKDADYAVNSARAKDAYITFLRSVGVLDKIEAITSPNVPGTARLEATLNRSTR